MARLGNCRSVQYVQRRRIYSLRCSPKRRRDLLVTPAAMSLPRNTTPMISSPRAGREFYELAAGPRSRSSGFLGASPWANERQIIFFMVVVSVRSDATIALFGIVRKLNDTVLKRFRGPET